MCIYPPKLSPPQNSLQPTQPSQPLCNSTYFVNAHLFTFLKLNEARFLGVRIFSKQILFLFISTQENNFEFVVKGLMVQGSA